MSCGLLNRPVIPAHAMRLQFAFTLLLIIGLLGCERQRRDANALARETEGPQQSDAVVPTVSPSGSLRVGMLRSEVIETLESLGASDITSGASYEDVATGEHVTEGIVYSLPHHDTTVALHYDGDGKLEFLIHCDGKDYGVSKVHRAISEVYCKRIDYNPDGSWTLTRRSTETG